MTRPFFQATAEQVINACEAVVVRGGSADPEFVGDFLDLPTDRASAALQLAVDVGFLEATGSGFSTASPLCRALVTPSDAQKAAALRVLLEVYEPFTTFRERLLASGSIELAARQTKTALDLDGHHQVVQETLVSLGTYSHALVDRGAGQYSAGEEAKVNSLLALAEGASDRAATELHILEQLGPNAAAAVSMVDVVGPLADGLSRALVDDGREAVLHAGNAVESFLTELATSLSVSLTGKTGINSKVEKLRTDGGLPTKLLNISKYLGHVRNAADHGIDPDVGAAWDITSATGIQYVYVACSFIRACADWTSQTYEV